MIHLNYLSIVWLRNKGYHCLLFISHIFCVIISFSLFINYVFNQEVQHITLIKILVRQTLRKEERKKYRKKPLFIVVSLLGSLSFYCISIPMPSLNTLQHKYKKREKEQIEKKNVVNPKQ